MLAVWESHSFVQYGSDSDSMRCTVGIPHVFSQGFSDLVVNAQHLRDSIYLPTESVEADSKAYAGSNCLLS